MSSEYVTVRFEPSGREAVVVAGTTLLDAARAAGEFIDSPCGGLGTCGSCRVRTEGDVSRLKADEAERLGGAGVAAGKRLACRARALGPVTVLRDAGPSASREGERILTASIVDDAECVSPEFGTPCEPAGTVGAAVDLGTTTIAIALVDLANGSVLRYATALNPQRVYGADVLSRISAELGVRRGSSTALVREEIERLLLDGLDRAGVAPERLRRVVVAGNTTMIALLLGRDVSPLATAPYHGADASAASVSAAQLGMGALPEAVVDTLPGVSAFVGGDVVAGVVATGLDARPGPSLFVDLGTNGEIVFARSDVLTATSAAAGPAFEGAAIEWGMRAETGAIERVGIRDGELELGVIGEVAAAGICGSGLVDLVALLLDEGVIEPDGRFTDVPVPLAEHIIEREDQRVFVVDESGGIVLTQKDVRQVQLAVAAVRTAMDLLLVGAEADAMSIAEVIIAGGFGHHLRPTALARIGLIPPEWAGRVITAGNTALAGARMVLVDPAAAVRAQALAVRIAPLDLAPHPEFQRRYIAALNFPA